MDENGRPRAWPGDAAPLVGIVRLRSDASREAVDALRSGGIELVEVTLTTPNALATVAALAREDPEACIGVGSVTSEQDAQRAIDAGARFLVTPTTDSSVLAAAQNADVPVVCGAYSPTEMLIAHTLGAALVKVFPASALGPGFLRDVLAPLPYLKLVPTGGVTVDNIPEWFAAGAAAVALGGAIVSERDASERAWGSVRSRAAVAVARTREAAPSSGAGLDR